MISFLTLLIFLGLTKLGSAQKDEGLIPKGFGSELVESITGRIQASCIFPDDKLLLRRIAYVETADGHHHNTYKKGYNGGIWKVDAKAFSELMTPGAMDLLFDYEEEIKKVFGINWSKLTWADCRKPLVSALAARLYILYASRNVIGDIPRDISSQAKFWKSFYRKNGNRLKFITMANALETGCKKSNGADIVFIIDGSGSITLSHFQTIKKFVKDVVNAFQYGPYRFSLIQFSTNVKVEFNLNTFKSKSQVLKAIDDMNYIGKGTKTYLALEYAANRTFLSSNGGRKGVPKVGIILTDGRSDNEAQTIEASRRLHDSSITLIAIGVGKSIDPVELKAMASQPKCSHQFVLSNFKEVVSLKYAIEKRACEAPIAFKNGTETIFIPAKGSVNGHFKIAPGGTKITVMPLSNTQSTMYLANDTFPSPSFFEQRIISTPSKPGVLFKRNPTNDFRFLYANFVGDNKTATGVNVTVDHGGFKTLVPTKPGSTYEFSVYSGDVEAGSMVVPSKGFTLSMLVKSGEGGHLIVTDLLSPQAETIFELKSTPVYPGIVYVKSPKIMKGKTNKTLSYEIRGDKDGNNTFLVKLVEGDHTHCSSNPCMRGNCREAVYMYHCDCPPGYMGRFCHIPSRRWTYDCEKKNPCTMKNILQGNVYFAHKEIMKFIQCRGAGRCSLNSCAAQTVWNDQLKACECTSLRLEKHA